MAWAARLTVDGYGLGQLAEQPLVNFSPRSPNEVAESAPGSVLFWAYYPFPPNLTSEQHYCLYQHPFSLT